MINSPEIFRNNIRKELNSFIDDIRISKKLEKNIFNWSISYCKLKNIIRKWENKFFVQIYLDKLKSIYYNIHPEYLKSSEKLLINLKNKTYSPKELVFMEHKELCPEKWKELIDEKIKRDVNSTKMDISASTDEFKCFKCHKRVCTYYELQTRSADEPMTTFVTCLNCGNRWKC